MVPRSSVMYRFMDDLFFCPVCGWWHIERWRDGRSDLYLHAVLRTIDLSSPDVDIADLRSYLLRQWPDRKYISPHAAEELVRTVIRDFTGLEVEYFRGNTFAPDGGVVACSELWRWRRGSVMGGNRALGPGHQRYFGSRFRAGTAGSMVLSPVWEAKPILKKWVT